MSWHTDRLKNQRRGATVAVVVECPNCGASGDDPCLTPAGNVKDTWHAKRSS